MAKDKQDKQAPIPADSAAIITMRLMTEGGTQLISPDTLSGDVSRPSLRPDSEGGRVATLETLFDYFINNVPDPDFALTMDPEFFERIRQQPDVHAAMRKREVTVASLPLTWKPSSERGVDPIEAQLMAQYCQDVWNSLPNVPELYRQMENAVLMGGQGHEFVWSKDADGISRPVSYFPVHKTRFIFDRTGNMAILTRNAPVWGAYVGNAPTRMSNGDDAWRALPGKFMYHKYMAEGGAWTMPAGEGYSYWGRGEDTNLYYPVKFDQFVLRFRLKWLEKHGMPLTVLYYSEGLVTDGMVRDVARTIRDETIALVPKQPSINGADTKESHFALDFIAPPPIGHDAFATFSSEWTAPAVEKILLGGADLMSLGDTGGYSASMNQREAGENMIYRYDAMLIDATINSQVVPYLVRAVPRWKNVPNGHLPRHMLTPERATNRMMELQILQTAAMLVPVQESAVYDAAGLNKPKDGSDGSLPEKTVFLGQPPAVGPDGQPMQGGGADGMPGVMTSGEQGGGRDAGLAQVESPRAEQTSQNRIQALERSVRDVSARLGQNGAPSNGRRQSLKRSRV